MKSNFTQALRELTGFDGQSGPQESAEKNNSELFTAEEMSSQKTIVPETVTTIKDFSEAPADSTRITKPMSGTGELKADDVMFVDGQLFGNVKTSATVHATDLIIGDVSAQNAFFSGARVKGNVTLTDDLIAGDNFTIVGDVKCSNASISGKIKGNCDIEHSAQPVR